MRTPRVYLDTSVISHLDQPKKPIEQEYSLRLWDAIIAGEYEVWLSDVVLTEINKCKPDKRERLFDFLSKIKHNNIPLTDELRTFANKILDQKILPSSCEEDSQHIAAAVLTNSEFLLSWNLKHLANFTTNDKVRSLSFVEYNREISIITPSFLLEGD
ncbi:MAG: PIN domain nuclease [Ruminococcus sp.]|jgi:predicted nucleic acid-binding protein|nr:PIN domain nuclease [Ruminococcus sp.]